MKYELAKELRDAGFPQKRKEGWWAPMLAELIAACGEEFNSLRQIKDKGWWAFSYKDDEHGNLIEVGNWPTPEEAVARLWLALNKKE